MCGLGLSGGDRCRGSLRSWLTIEISRVVLLETSLRGLAVYNIVSVPGPIQMSSILTLVIRVVRTLLVITHVAHTRVEPALLMWQLPRGGGVGGGGRRFGFLDRGSGVAGGIVRIVRL